MKSEILSLKSTTSQVTDTKLLQVDDCKTYTVGDLAAVTSIDLTEKKLVLNCPLTNAVTRMFSLALQNSIIVLEKCKLECIMKEQIESIFGKSGDGFSRF